jgi:hypothetical protein
LKLNIKIIGGIVVATLKDLENGILYNGLVNTLLSENERVFQEWQEYYRQNRIDYLNQIIIGKMVSLAEELSDFVFVLSLNLSNNQWIFLVDKVPLNLLFHFFGKNDGYLQEKLFTRINKITFDELKFLTEDVDTADAGILTETGREASRCLWTKIVSTASTKEEWVWFLNKDCVFFEDWNEILLERINMIMKLDSDLQSRIANKMQDDYKKDRFKNLLNIV